MVGRRGQWLSSMTEAVDVGVVGLGAMGGPIARNLAAAGLHVAGYDLEESRRSALSAAGGRAFGSAETLAAEAPVILTLLPSPAALEDITAAIARGARERAAKPILVEMSTFSEATKQRARDALEPLGVAVLDCPLSGTAVQAAAGDLVIYASGDDAAIDRCADVFGSMARGVHRLGPFGTGTRTKLVANLLVAIHIVSSAEALVLARAAGLDLERTLTALTDGAGTSRMLEVRGPMMVREEFTSPSMTLRLFAKDEGLIREFAAALDVDVPLFEDASRLLRRASDSGRAEEDTSAVYASLVEAMAHTAP
jgi:putative dehydrogenase